MTNPLQMMVQNMIRQGGGNIQAVAQNILRNNPQFAQRIQGQNVQQMAIDAMKRQGIDPQAFMNGIFSGR